MVQYWESNWLNIESQIDSTIESQIDSYIIQLLTLLGRIIISPVTQLLRSTCLIFFSWCTERKIESFWPKKLWHLSWNKNIWIEKKKIYIYIYIYIVLVTQSVMGKRGNLVLLLKILISKIHQNYCDINYILK